MDSFTHFLKSKQARLVLAAWRGRIALAFVVSALFAIVCTPSAYAASSETSSVASISALQVERGDGGVFLNAQINFDLPASVEDVLLKGIPLIFVAEAEVRRDRWYWYDKKLAAAARQIRLAYQPLTRKWRLNIANLSGNSGVGLGGGIPQYFDSLSEAMTKIQRISRWRIVDLADLDPDALHTIELSFKLDISQLPRPFQIGLIGQGEWNISIAKSIRFLSEASK